MKRVVAARGIAAMAVASVAVFATLPGEAAISAARFTTPQRLGPWLGGEPSIAFDPTGNGAVYIVAPQGGPAIGYAVEDALVASGFFDPLNSSIRGGTSGVAFWASTDSGRTFRLSKNIGTGFGGFDADVVVAPDHRVYVADLEIAASAVCVSTDQGRDFSGSGVPGDACQKISLDHAGPSNDREWLSLGRKGELYMTYHEVTTGLPVILASTDNAKTFTPCGSILDVRGPAGANYSPLGGTLVSKPVVGRDGSIYVTVSEPDLNAYPAGGPLTNLYLAVARGGCNAQTVFSNYKIYANRGADFTLFNFLGMDGGGVLYAVAAGKTAKGQANDSVWLFVSRNRGVSWSAPIRVNPPAVRGNAMPAVVGGTRGNQVAIGWFGTTTSGDPTNGKNQWRFYVATSFDGGRRFYHSTVTRSPIHFGAICTLGVFCNPAQESGNRNLVDFASIAVHPRTGCVMVAIPGDPWNRPDLDEDRNDRLSAAYVATQASGTCLR